MNQAFGRNRVLVAVASAAAFFVGGAITYSISAVSASSVTSQQVVAAAPQGRNVDCLNLPDMDWGSRSTPLLPDLVSFRTGGAVQGRESDPCDGDGDDGGGGGGGPSCLSTFGFDPDDYWVVFNDADPFDPTVANLVVADINTLEALGATDLATDTGCNVTLRWAMPFDGSPISGLLDFLEAMNGGSISTSGATSTQLSITGMDDGGWTQYQLYSQYVCGGSVGLEVSDGTEDFYIIGPDCSFYQFDSTLVQPGQQLSYAYSDPWGRPMTGETRVATLGSVNEDGLGVIAQYQSAPAITFELAGIFTLKKSDITNDDCDNPLTPIFSNQSQGAGSVWTDPSPPTGNVADRLYCISEVPN